MARIRSDMQNGPTWVYQAVSERDSLLYVGVASDLPRRLTQHRATKSWWPQVYAVVAGLYPTRHQALAVELGIIRGAGQGPVHNIAGRQPVRSGRSSATKWVLLDRNGAPMPFEETAI